MWLNGSCHCGGVTFRVLSHAPYPYMSCYCSICRKTAGGGGYAINIMAEAATLEVNGEEHLHVYQAWIDDPDRPGEKKQSPARRHFCSRCASALWIADPRWSQWVYPFASAVDTPLPVPPEHTRIMLEFAATWCEIPGPGRADHHFRGYPDEGIMDWHRRLQLYQSK